MAGKEAVCLECWPELAHGGAALSTMGCSSTLSACWLAEVSWWGKRRCWGDAGGTPGTRHPCCGSHRPAGHRPEMQAMALSHLHINIAVPLDHLLASMSLMLTAQECTGQGTLWVPPPHSSWVGQRCCLPWVSAGWRSSSTAAHQGWKCSIYPISRNSEPFQACFVAWKQGRFELWRFWTCFLPQSCKGHLSQHIVVKF